MGHIQRMVSHLFRWKVVKCLICEMILNWQGPGWACILPQAAPGIMSALCLSEVCLSEVTARRTANTKLLFKNGEKNKGFVYPATLPLISLKTLKQMVAVLFESRDKVTGWWVRAGSRTNNVKTNLISTFDRWQRRMCCCLITRLKLTFWYSLMFLSNKLTN